MKYFAIFVTLLLSACATSIPVKQSFPVAPSALLERCPDLLIIDDGKNSLRDMLKVVIQNYATYYQCAEKTHSWQEWYNTQKKIYE